MALCSFFGVRGIDTNDTSMQVSEKNFYFDDINKNKGFWVIQKHILGMFQMVIFFHSWQMDKLFLSLTARKKSSNFTHTLMYGNTCQKWKLWIPPKIYVQIFLWLGQLRLLGSLLCFPSNKENSPCRNLETLSTSWVRSKNKSSISIVSCQLAKTSGFWKSLPDAV